MGRPKYLPGEYRDDPDALSLQTTPDDYTYDDAPEINGLPPSYDDSEGDIVPAAGPSRPIRYVPPSRYMDHDNAFVQSGGKIRVCDTQKTMDARYDLDPEYLEQRIKTMSLVPPNPLIYIVGTHRETVRNGDKKEVKDIIDFRLVINMGEYLVHDDQTDFPMKLGTATNGEKTYRGSFMKKRAPGAKQDIEVGSDAPTLREWCHRYCASPSRLRIFRLRREVFGLDSHYLAKRIEGLIRSTSYRGRVRIEFPVENENVDIYTANRINEWRLKTWVRWLFYLTFLWIFSWPYLFFATKRYAVVKANWFFSTLDENDNKIYATISEEEWFDRWHIAIRRYVLEGFQGEATYERMQGVINRPADPPTPGRPATGNVNVDNAVGLLQQGFRVARAISRGDPMAGLQDGWGYDTV
ncbi:uncharacterized protein EI97DRAFT_437514 [Westerdykella ornata]|uniref:Uncharacterized protein n=1 Tax=Westerdykella ornata TaxID=318751 RepID=A0A6A6J5X3_WESOR|nr:uncharacterized protein EI97DRAFT_437514 [Westerdykella ornata]KAF2271835.1 hypothetical protein EI97DRAFT_437514 [Westerdykella ornata]